MQATTSNPGPPAHAEVLFSGRPWAGICLPRYYGFACLLLVIAIIANELGVPSRVTVPVYAICTLWIVLSMLYRILVISRLRVVIYPIDRRPSIFQEPAQRLCSFCIAQIP
jgi:hypothetical protein